MPRDKRRKRYRLEESKLGIAGTDTGGIRHRQIHRHLFFGHFPELWTVLRAQLPCGAGPGIHHPDLWADDPDHHSKCHRRHNRAGGISLHQVVHDGMLVKPFCKLEGFAERIAGGNLDIPLEMDRQNLFGAFTESFDLMRAELKKARLAQAKANAGKKELVAKLSHDIKTPVASIKAAAEVGAALAKDGRMKENYGQIIQKADQVNSLVTNLFTATLEELQELTVTPVDMESKEVGALLENADYLHRAKIPEIPPCLVWADRLRLQQVFDNVFVNSYKYADTDIMVQAGREGSRLVVVIEDYGGGLLEEEVFYIKEKFRRGANAKEIEGAGLGLFISDYFMEAMDGRFIVENGENGLKASVVIPLSGTV